MRRRREGVGCHVGMDMTDEFFDTPDGYYGGMSDGYYGHPVFDDECVTPRYDKDGNLTGFMVEGALDFNWWHDVDLAVVDDEQAARKETSAQAE